MHNLNIVPYRSVPNTSRVPSRDLKVLKEVEHGDIIEIRGDLLQPFCSHALYCMAVTVNRCIGPGMHRIIGVLIDFKDSPVQSYALKESRMFRVVGRRESLS